MLDVILDGISNKRIPHKATYEILKCFIENNTHNLEEAIKLCKLDIISNYELEEKIDEIINKNINLVKKHGLGSAETLMGIAIKELGSKSDGKIIFQMIKTKIKSKLN